MGGIEGWVWCFLPLSDDGGVFTASFIIMCGCHVWAWWPRGSISNFGNFKTPVTRPNAGLFWQVLVQCFFFFGTLLPHCPVHQVLTGIRGAELLRVVERLEHIPLLRERIRQVRLRALFFCKWMFLPIIYEVRVEFELRRVALKWNDFSVGTHSLLCLCSHLRSATTLKTKTQIVSLLPCLLSYLLFLQTKKEKQEHF